jgi:hypothetical protein
MVRANAINGRQRRFCLLNLASAFVAACWKVPRDLIRTDEDSNMWLFTGRYAHLGAAICLITFVVASVGIVFVTRAARLIQRRDLNVPNIFNVLLVAVPASLLGYAVGSGEPVYVSDSLNLGEALFLAVVGIVLGLIGVTLPSRLRPLRVLVLFAASAVLFGDLTGWILRSAAPSKYTSPIGGVHPVPPPRDWLRQKEPWRGCFHKRRFSAPVGVP